MNRNDMCHVLMSCKDIIASISPDANQQYPNVEDTAFGIAETALHLARCLISDDLERYGPEIWLKHLKYGIAEIEALGKSFAHPVVEISPAAVVALGDGLSSYEVPNA